jgi:hypothetical protein
MGWCNANEALVHKAQSPNENALVQTTTQLQVLLCNKMGLVVGGYLSLHYNLIIVGIILLWVYNILFCQF